MNDSGDVDAAKHDGGGDAMPVLLADVGGTNTRVAVARGGTLASMRRYENAQFTSLYDLLSAHLKGADVGAIDACSVAMAGPVRGGEGRLTNRDWQISCSGLQAALGCDRVVLQNDLTALGYALGTLGGDSLHRLGVAQQGQSNGQALVIGIGTGFNLCPVGRGAQGRVQCLEVEMGHAALPAPVRDMLGQCLGPHAAAFTTLEALFSGGGLAHFHLARIGRAATAQQVVEAHAAGAAAAGETLEIYTALLGAFCRELSFQYMPLEGMYFAGSVARGILRPEFHKNLQARTVAGDKLGDLLAGIPKWTILDDAAALRGCLAAITPS